MPSRRAEKRLAAKGVRDRGQRGAAIEGGQALAAIEGARGVPSKEDRAKSDCHRGRPEELLAAIKGGQRSDWLPLREGRGVIGCH